MNKSLNQDTYEKLKKDIMTFAFSPGEYVSAAKIAERYDVSRTPARETLVRLSAEGLVEIYPQSKSVISKIDVDRVRQEWFVRKTLEMGMIDTFFERVTKKDIEEMENTFVRFMQVGKLRNDTETSYEYLSLDNEFHAVMYRVTGEKLAAEIIGKEMAHYNRLRLLIDLDNVYKDRTVSDHEELLELVKKGDREQYREKLGAHLSHVIGDIEDVRSRKPELFTAYYTE